MNTEAGKHEGMSALTSLENTELTQQQVSDLQMHKEFIENFDMDLDSKDNIKIGLLQSKLNKLGIKDYEGQALSEDTMWGDKTASALEKAKNLLNKYQTEKNPVLLKSQEKTQGLSEELPEEKPKTTVVLEQIIKTKEKTDSTLEGTFSNKIDGSELRGLINSNSLNELLLSGENIKTLFSDLSNIAKNNNLDTETNEKGEKIEIYDFTPFNISELKTEFRKYGYEADGFFGGEEMGALFQILENVVETQKSIPDLNIKDKIGILLDYNADGALDDNVHFYTKEIELFNEIKDETEFSNLLTNLGYNGVEDFNKQFGDNYFVARENFKTRLANILDNRLNINPVELLESKTAVTEKVKAYNDAIDAIEGNEKYKEIQLMDKDLANKIKFEGAGLILGATEGGAVSFNISEVTNQIIDSIQFGVINGTLGFSFNKKLINIDDGAFTLNIGAANFIPYIAASAKLYESKLEEFENLFPNKIEEGARVTFGAGVTITGAGVGLDLSRIDENTERGMEQMLEQMGITLDKILVFIEKGQAFEETGLNDSKENRDAFNRLGELYNSYGDAGIVFLKEGALNNYKRELYEQASGGHLVGISAGASIGFDEGFGKILGVIGIHGEYHSIEWKESQKAVDKNTTSSEYMKGIETRDVELA
ncbi:MAG: hypothetical protein QM490_03965, partial [Candidatus Gracilibacteria bacterium]